MHSKVYEITYPFLNFNGCTVEIWKWINCFVPHFIMDAITYLCCDFSLCCLLYGEITWAPGRLKSPSTLLFVRKFIDANIKYITKVHFTGPWWWESTGDRPITPTMANKAETISMSWCHHDDKSSTMFCENIEESDRNETGAEITFSRYLEMVKWSITCNSNSSPFVANHSTAPSASVALLLTWFNLSPSMDKQLHAW